MLPGPACRARDIAIAAGHRPPEPPTSVEGYAGLVVHGPLQATLMLNIAASTTGRLPQKFRYRGSEPLICGTPFAVEALKDGNGRLTTRVVARAGFITMTGTVEP